MNSDERAKNDMWDEKKGKINSINSYYIHINDYALKTEIHIVTLKYK